MDSYAEIKQKVTNTVKRYQDNNREEFLNFRKQQQYLKDNLKNDWAEMKGSDIIVRKLNEYPELLNAMIKMALSSAEYEEFRSTKLQLWFGNTFSDYRVTNQRL